MMLSQFRPEGSPHRPRPKSVWARGHHGAGAQGCPNDQWGTAPPPPVCVPLCVLVVFILCVSPVYLGIFRSYLFSSMCSCFGVSHHIYFLCVYFGVCESYVRHVCSPLCSPVNLCVQLCVL